MRRKRRTRCFNCGELSVNTHNVYQFKSDKELEEYRKVKYDYRTNIMDYLDKSKKVSYCDDCFEDVEH